MITDTTELKAFLNCLCDAAAAQTLPRFRSNLKITNKLEDDFDPVTEGDREAERAIRKLIEEAYPEHGIIGEEFGTLREDAEFQWIIDPIDGTRAFISGLPVWGTLIGLYRNGTPFAGMMHQPFTRERFLAVPGSNPSQQIAQFQYGSEDWIPLQTSAVTDLAQATLMTTAPHILQNDQDRSFFELEKHVKLSRYGCDCYAYCMVAAGQIDIVVESGLNVYDIAALIPIIEGAGGIVTNWQGGDASTGGQILACANAELSKKAQAILNA